MNRLRIALRVVLLFFLLVLGAGFLLPERYSAEEALVSAHPPREVWDALQRFENNPMTGALMKRFVRLADERGLPAWIEDLGETRIHVAMTDASPLQSAAFAMTDSATGVSARLVLKLTPRGGGTRLEAAWMTRVPASPTAPLFRFAMLTSNGARSSARGYLEGVARTLGETPVWGSGRGADGTTGT